MLITHSFSDHMIDKHFSFLEYLNYHHGQIKFTTEIESDSLFPFCNVLVKRLPNSRLVHAVYRKPTDADISSN